MKYCVKIKYLNGKNKIFKYDSEKERDLCFVYELNTNDNIDTIEWYEETK